jgi:hypothetical protein
VRSTSWKDGDRSGTLAAVIEWRDPGGKPLLVENRDMIFYPGPTLRRVVIHPGDAETANVASLYKEFAAARWSAPINLGPDHTASDENGT